jgi:hypothetical protein
MSHREEAPRQELCMKCGRLLPRMHNCFEDSEPSCNSSLQESQKLTNGEQTPLTDAAEVSFAKELYPYALMTGLARQLELSLSQCREALEKERERGRVLDRQLYNMADGLLAWTLPSESNLTKRYNSRVWAEKVAALPSAPKE